MTRIPVPPFGTEPVKPDMSVAKVREIRTRLNELLDGCAVYPRRFNRIDGVSLALYSRISELHESLCVQRWIYPQHEFWAVEHRA